MSLSIWESTSFPTPPRFTVIGAGIVGLWTAIHHKRRFPGHSVLVLERGPGPSGASLRNAGFACFGSPSELLADIAREGRDAALQRAEERWRGLLELRKELGDEAIGFEATGGHEIYKADDALYNRVAEGFDTLNTDLRVLFGREVYARADELLGAFGIMGMGHLIRTELEGPLDSGRLMSALMAKAQEAGVAMRTHAEVVAMVEQRDGVVLVLADGTHVMSAQVLVATNGFTPSLLPELDVHPARGQVLLTEPIAGLRLRGTFHMDEGYYYFRDCRGGILLGGGRHLDFEGERTAEPGTTPLIQDALERLIRDHLTDQPVRIRLRWSGVMAFGKEAKEPLVQRLNERMGVAVRLSGMGVAIGIRVARKAVEMMAE